MGASNSRPGLGLAIRKLRKDADLTLDEVCTGAGISTNYLSRVENGLVSPTDAWVAMVVAEIGRRLSEAA